VTVVAIGRKSCRDVIGAGDLEIILLVTSDATSGVKREIALWQALVAALAIGQGMTAHQGEVCFSMDVLNIENREAIGCVTSVTLGSKFTLVDVFMAGDTFGIDDGKVFESVTAGAFGVAVTPFEDKAGAIGVIESHPGPFLQRMAYIALKFHVFVGHFLGERPFCRKYER